MRRLCEALGVSPSGYYAAQRPARGPRQLDDAVLAAKIAAVHRRSRRNYGAPRIVRELQEEGVYTSRRRCARLLRAQGLRGRKKQARRPRTTDSGHGQPVVENRLAKSPAPSGPNEVWLTDITYLRTAEGWLFLAAILDAWSRRVVGWACAPTLHTSLVLTALQRALHARRPPRGFIHHSDRGCQYVDAHYVQALTAAGAQRSMSRAGNCYDNATMESFWSTLKTESDLADRTTPTRRQAELAVFDYIETFYNPTRRHSSLGYHSPVAFEKQPTPTKIKAA